MPNKNDDFNILAWSALEICLLVAVLFLLAASCATVADASGLVDLSEWGKK